MHHSISLAALVLAVASPSRAQHAIDEGAEQACASPAQPWLRAANMTAASGADGLAAARLVPGEPVVLELSADPEVAYLSLPQGEGEASSFGGMVRVEIGHGGRYRIGLGEPAWVDVVSGGVAAEPVDFGRAAACSGLRKQVTFDLEPGFYTLEISGNLSEIIGVVVDDLTPK